MGIEYKLRFAISNFGQVESLLHTMSSLSRFEAISALYEFRSPHNANQIPDAFVKIESDGLYFCDNGGEGQQILKDLSQKIAREFGVFVLEDL
jgi:hypothetical protein